MARAERRFDFTLDRAQLALMVLTAYQAAEQKEGFFSGGLEKYLPEWNLPDELEKFPKEIRPAHPFQAARYLWLCAFFERINKSSHIIRNAQRAWSIPDKRWIFDPFKVAIAPLSEIERIVKDDFQFNLQSNGENTPAERLKFNNILLMTDYDGDPRNIVAYKTVAQARHSLMEFQGIGTGIANLYLIYLMHRKIAFPRDPDNAFLKVDLHKGRLPINCDAVKPTNGQIYRDESYVRRMEHEYREVCRQHRLDVKETDSALWVIGSEGCAKQDYTHCKLGCPLFNLCRANAPEDKSTGRYVIYDNKHHRIDSRQHISQGVLPFVQPTSSDEETRPAP